MDHSTLHERARRKGVNRAFYWWCRVMITCKYFSLPNLIAGRPVMPEFAPVDDPEPAIYTMTELLHRWLTDAGEYLRHQAVLTRLRDEVATPGATENAARVILERLGVPRVQRAA